MPAASELTGTKRDWPSDLILPCLSGHPCQAVRRPRRARRDEPLVGHPCVNGSADCSGFSELNGRRWLEDRARRYAPIGA